MASHSLKYFKYLIGMPEAIQGPLYLNGSIMYFDMRGFTILSKTFLRLFIVSPI